MTIHWSEINPSASQWGLAGPTDTPATTPGQGAGALVQFASQSMANRAINSAIQRMLTTESATVERMLPQVRTEGVLAVIRITVWRQPDGQRQYVNPLLNRPLIMANNIRTALELWRAQPRLEATPRQPIESYNSRIFWARRV